MMMIIEEDKESKKQKMRRWSGRLLKSMLSFRKVGRGGSDRMNDKTKQTGGNKLNGEMTASPCSSCDLPFEQVDFRKHILEDEVMLEHFKVYCASQWSEENLNFFLEVEEFKTESDAAFEHQNISGSGSLLQRAKLIYETYLCDNAEHWCCVDPRLVEHIETRLRNENFEKTDFNQAQAAVRRNIENDALHRFLLNIVHRDDEIKQRLAGKLKLSKPGSRALFLTKKRSSAIVPSQYSSCYSMSSSKSTLSAGK